MGKAAKLVDNVLKVGKVPNAEIAATVRVGGRVARQTADEVYAPTMDDLLGQFEKNADVDEYLTTPPKDTDVLKDPAQVQAEVQRLNAESGDRMRLRAISDPKVANVQYMYQSASPEEFTTRVQNQLFDPEYAANVVSMDSQALSGTRIKPSVVAVHMEQDNLMQARVKGPLYQNKRYQAKVKQVTKDAAYEDRVFFHIEQQAAPDGSFPQFGDNPNEMGVHSGTYNAAVQATYKSDEALMQAHEAIREDLEQLAFPLNMSVKQIEKEITPVLEDYFIELFESGRGMKANNVWNEVGLKLSDRMRSAGFPEVEVGAFIARLKRLPTPSVTPHYFTGKNGLHLSDAEGNFFEDTVFTKLKRIFPEDEKMLDELGSNPRALQAYIEQKGYDHIVYHNQAEDVGTVSLINWNPDLMVSLYDPKLAGNGSSGGASAAAAFVMAAAGLNNADIRTEE